MRDVERYIEKVQLVLNLIWSLRKALTEIDLLTT